MLVHDWSQIGKEELNPKIVRQVVHTGNATVAKIQLAKGAIVPEHSHVHEQITILLSGRVKLICQDREQIVEAGQLIQMPPDAPHGLEALEESQAIDVFTPRRDDWVRQS
jgi:quercetin dioxygenase-like cupin family protein